MKKLVTLLLAAGLVFSAANSASAVELKASGTWDMALNWSQNIFSPFQDYKDSGKSQKYFDAVQRMRLTFDFVVSENLSATYQVQVGRFTWGGAPANTASKTIGGQGGNSSENLGGRIATRSANIVTRLAYLDWTVPNTSVKVRMGQQNVTLPSFTFGSPVLDDNATGIVVSAPVTDTIGVTALWVRAASGWERGNGNAVNGLRHDAADLFGLIGDLKFDGVTVQPWVVVGAIGRNSEMLGYYPEWKDDNPELGNATAWWAGISAELTMFDPFRFTADFIYNNMSVSHTNPETKWLETDAWYAALGAEYKTAYGTPALKGWYASGDKRLVDAGGTKKRGRLLELSGGFNATNTYFDGGFPVSAYYDYCSPLGTWGISAQWNDLSFVENLSHSFSVTYVQGTNNKANAGIADAAAGYLTTKDSFVELDMTHKYNIYKNLAAIFEVGYIIEDFAKNVTVDAIPVRDNKKYSDAWRATVGFRYSF